jgi:hypothetical protein
MTRSKIGFCFSLLAILLLSGCAADHPANNENARIQSQTTVTKDQIPAEGQRKIPVTEQY